jgi:hypothetical protein
MLDDDAGGSLVELLHALQGGIRVGDIVVGEFFALDLGGRGDTCLPRVIPDVEGGGLVRVLPVTHPLLLVHLDVEGARQTLGLAVGIQDQGPQVVGDGPVVAGGVLEGLHR